MKKQFRSRFNPISPHLSFSMNITMATIIVDPADPLALHKLIYLNKVQTLKMLLAPYTQHSSTADAAGTDGTHDTHPQKQSQQHHPQINTLDHHLLAPLHLAVMLNRKEAVSLLLKAGANPMARSGTGWTPRQEATSLGDRSLIELFTRHQRKEFSGSFKQKALNLVKQLSNVTVASLCCYLILHIVEVSLTFNVHRLCRIWTSSIFSCNGKSAFLISPCQNNS